MQAGVIRELDAVTVLGKRVALTAVTAVLEPDSDQIGLALDLATGDAVVVDTVDKAGKGLLSPLSAIISKPINKFSYWKKRELTPFVKH